MVEISNEATNSNDPHRKRSEIMREAWRKRKEKGGKGICEYCKKPVYAGGVREEGKLYHEVCQLMMHTLREYEEKKQKGLVVEPVEVPAATALALTDEQSERLKDIEHLPVENRIEEFLKGFYPATIRASLKHSPLQRRLEEVGSLLGYTSKRNYPEPQSGWEYDVVWKEAEKLPPSHAFEVQDKGNLDSALVKLKHAKDIWRCQLFLIVTREHDRARLDRVLERHLSGAFHEISSLIKVLTPEDVIDAWQNLFTKWHVLKDFLSK